MTQITAIDMPDANIRAKAYGSKHDFENYSKEFTFYWFEYVPYHGLIRVHDSGDEERCDYYLKYEEFLSRLSELGYDKLIPCGYLYENIADAYENIGRTSNTREVLDDFISGNIDALYYVEEVSDIPEESFVMRSYEDCYEYITAGEEELIIHAYTGARAFFDVIGDTVYEVIETV